MSRGDFGLVLQIVEPELHPQVGEFLEHFDPEGGGGRGTLRTTTSLDHAKKFQEPEQIAELLGQRAVSGYPSLQFFGWRVKPVMEA